MRTSVATRMLLLFVLAGATPSRAICTKSEIASFDRALTATMVCASRILRSGASCTTPAPPSCAGDAVTEVLDLLGGLPSGESDNRDQVRCQIAAYKGARKFLRLRIRERARGIRRQQVSSRALRLNRRCNVRILTRAGGRSEPNFGAPCLEQATKADSSLAGERLGQCIRPRLEGVASSLLGVEPLRPNIVLIVTDDQHPEAINSMPTVLSEIVDRGVHFANSFTTTPLCTPSRATILTGQHATTHGVLTNDLDLGEGGAAALDDSSTLATWLQSAGYRTALIGKYLNGYFADSPEVPEGWDEWQVFVNDRNNFFDYDLNENGVHRFYGGADTDYSTDLLTGRATEFVEENADSPFFLLFAPFAPHLPSTPAPRHDGLLAGSPPWRPPAWGENIDDKPARFRFFAVPTDDLPAFDADVLRQRESLLSVDEGVASILATLEDRGLSDNTLVLFTSDHGILWGEHRWTDKNVPYEEAIRVPLAMRYPLSIAAGTTEHAIVTNLDIAPTVAAFAGIQPSHVVEGRSLADLLDGALDWRTDFVVQFFTSFLTLPWDGLRTQRYKYVRYPDGAEELYDLETDPFELDNQAQNGAFMDLRSELSGRLDELLAEAPVE